VILFELVMLLKLVLLSPATNPTQKEKAAQDLCLLPQLES